MFFLLVGGAGDDGGAGERRGIGCRGKTRVAPCELFVDDGLFERPQTGSAVGLRDVKVQQSHFMSCLDGFLWVVSGFIPVLRMRTDLVPGKLVGEFLQHGLHLVELEVHHGPARHRSLKSD